MTRSFPNLGLSMILAVFLFTLSPSQAQTTYDVFPLNKSHTWLYSYQYRYSDRELAYLVASQADSGTVRYTVTDSSAQADTAIRWAVRQQEHLRHYRFDLVRNLDTTYWTDRDTLIFLMELTTGKHQLICSSSVWSFPLSQPSQPVFRYADSSTNALFRLDPTVYMPNFRVDSLIFDAARGLYWRCALSQFGVNTRTIYSLAIALISSSTFVPADKFASIHAFNFQLLPNFPNPFNPSTTIIYQLSTQAYVTLKIFDQLGRLVEVLYRGHQVPGNHFLTWYPRGISSGVYFVTLNIGVHSQTRKLILLQ